MNPKAFDVSRRQFFRQACCAAVGTTGILSALSQLRMIGAVSNNSIVRPSAAAAHPGDYKALICLFLNGGNDSDNLIVPNDPTAYASYARSRANLALPQTGLLTISPRQYSDGRSYALHPSVRELQSLFNAGNLAVVANVGTLLQPTTLSQYKAGRALPPQLFSHIDQLTQWQSSLPDRPFETGWGGRLADMVDAFNSNNRISMSITLNGTNRFQVGKQVMQYSVNSGGVQQLSGGSGSARYAGIKSLYGGPKGNLLEAAFGAMNETAVENSEILAAAISAAPRLTTAFPSTQTAARLAMIARLISVAPALGLKRQVFFCQLGGFDLHGGQKSAHGPLLAELSAAMKGFHDATVELGIANQVTTFTASDFGRTYIPNGDGTDHGWGGHQLVLGGAVRGGDIYGTMPSLTIGGSDDTGRGKWLPSTSVDEYNATLATWFGVSASNLPVVLPNIGRFAKPNLGFMA